MPGIFQSLDIARRAIWASRLGMDVTSHNIANVNTEGFSRQRVDNRAAYPISLPSGQLGMGVNVDNVTRIRNNLLDTQYRQTNHTLGYAESKESMYGQIEIIFQDPGENSVGTQVNDFLLEFSHLSTDTENSAIRNSIRQKAGALAESFQAKDRQLNEMRGTIRDNVKASVDRVNEITRQIAELNGQISSSEVNAYSANDLRDRRDQLLDSLSQYTKINFTEDATGKITVVAEGLNLVSGLKSNQLSMETTGSEGDLQIAIKNSNGQEAGIRYGKLGGMLEMHNEKISDLMANLDNMAGKLIEEVNRIHSSGYGLPQGNPPVSSTGINFFSGTSASTINLSEDIEEDINNIAASTDGSPGNGDVAIALSSIRNTKMFNGGTETFEDHYTGVIKNLAVDIESAQNTKNSYQLLKNQISNQKNSESGVSLDEEMTNLIKYQRSFEAAAKVIGVVDEMMQTVLNMV